MIEHTDITLLPSASGVPRLGAWVLFRACGLGGPATHGRKFTTWAVLLFLASCCNFPSAGLKHLQWGAVFCGDLIDQAHKPWDVRLLGFLSRTEYPKYHTAKNFKIVLDAVKLLPVQVRHVRIATLQPSMNHNDPSTAILAGFRTVGPLLIEAIMHQVYTVAPNVRVLNVRQGDVDQQYQGRTLNIHTGPYPIILTPYTGDPSSKILLKPGNEVLTWLEDPHLSTSLRLLQPSTWHHSLLWGALGSWVYGFLAAAFRLVG